MMCAHWIKIIKKNNGFNSEKKSKRSDSEMVLKLYFMFRLKKIRFFFIKRGYIIRLRLLYLVNTILLTICPFGIKQKLNLKV